MITSKARLMMNKQSVWKPAVLAIFSIMSVVPATAAMAQCEAEVDAALQEAKIPQSDVKSITVNADTGGGNAPRLVGYTAWVTRNSCTGKFVVNLSTSCRVKDTYATGDCKDK